MTMIRKLPTSLLLFLTSTAHSATAFAPASLKVGKPLIVGQVVTQSPLFFQQQQQQQQYYHRTTSVLMMARKAGVASPEELKEFVEKAGDKLVVVDTRNPDANVEPGDQKSLAVAGLPTASFRPKALHLIWDRTTDSMPLPDLDDKSTPIITHCGGGGRGQKAKDFLEENGFTNVKNGGGPKETECWAEFGSK